MNGIMTHMGKEPKDDLLLVVTISWLFFSNFFGHGFIVYSPKLLNPFPNKPWFLRVCDTSLLKTYV